MDIPSEQLVNSTIEGAQLSPSIGQFNNGSKIIIWENVDTNYTTTIQAQFYDADGNKQGLDFTLVEDAISKDAVVTVLEDGNFLVTWLSNEPNGLSHLKGQIFNAEATAVGEQILIDSSAGDYYDDDHYVFADSDVIALSDGGFIVSRYSDAHLATTIYNADGSIRANLPESPLNPNTSSVMNLTELSNGNIVITWADNTTGNDADIFTQIITPAGETVSSPINVSAAAVNDQLQPAVTATADGGFAVAWVETELSDIPYGYEELASKNLAIQTFDANGLPLNQIIIQNSFEIAYDTQAITLETLPNGQMMIFWEQDATIITQRLDADGNKIGDSFVPYQNASNDQITFDTSVNADGSITLSFADFGTEEAPEIDVYQVTVPTTLSGDKSVSLTEDQNLIGYGELEATGTLSTANLEGVSNTFTAQTITGEHGTFTISENGNWSYTALNYADSIQSLGEGDISTETFTVTTTDGLTDTVTITINGTNDSAGFFGDTDANLYASSPTNEEGLIEVTGKTDVWDLDIGEDTIIAGTYEGTLGALTIAEDGSWTYASDPQSDAVRAIGDNDYASDLIYITTADGTTFPLLFNVYGVNDAAVFSGDDHLFTTKDTDGDGDGLIEVEGWINNDDIDLGDYGFQQNVTQTNYGRLAITEYGHWSYEADKSHPDIAGLKAGESVTESVTIYAKDGTAHTLSVTIDGVSTGDDTAPIVITVTEDQNVNELGEHVREGVIDPATLGRADSEFYASYLYGNYGTFTINEQGEWSYKAYNQGTPLQGLKSGEQDSETFTVTTTDGYEKTITVNLIGQDDTPFVYRDVYTSTQAYNWSAGEGNGKIEHHGALEIIDSDAGDRGFIAEVIETDLGTLTISENGLWVYEVDANHSTVVALGENDSYLEVITVTTKDGTPFDMLIDVKGYNDPAIIGGDDYVSVLKTEDHDWDGLLEVGGTLTYEDVDRFDYGFKAEVIDTDYGQLTMTEHGEWSYAADRSNEDISSLQAGQSIYEYVTVHANDGTAHTITITIEGKNDSIYGTSGRDTLIGNDYADTIYGFDGNDYIFGFDGGGFLYGGKGSDAIYGGDGNDITKGEDGNDAIYAGGGNDRMLDGGAGDDLIHGGDGNDIIYGNSGSDFISGDAGNDILYGDYPDSYDADQYADTFYFGPNSGKDVIRDFDDGLDIIDLSYHGITFDDLTIREEIGDTVISFNDTEIRLDNFNMANLSADDFNFG